MIIREVDRDVLETLRRLPALETCRSLDALHLATAMLFQEHLDKRLKLCALDGRMRTAAKRLQLMVVPD